ncbi:MAG: DNA-3-methyladenine glycosylase 2 [Deltaproteobacteria bacterium]|nr:DNA-3-methyladenine glycosylase 2 [Deltaproteobacteria bacterium]
MERAVTTLRPIPPYDFDLTAAYATYFRGHYGAESFRDNVFRRLLDFGDRLCLVSVRSTGTIDSPLLELEVQGAALDETVVSEARRLVARILGADQDMAPFYGMAFEDPMLARLARGLRGLHVPNTVSVYEALVLAILGQQISSHVARMLRTLLIQTYGPSLEVSAVTYHAFPRPQALMAAGAEGLRSIKLSSRKARYIAEIAAGVASGELDLESLRRKPDEDVIRTLTGLRGVGPWTAQWLLIRALGRTDGFPHGDLALLRTMGSLLNAGSPLDADAALAYSRRWSPFRSYVTTYLFAAVRSGRFTDLSQTGDGGP